MHAHRQGFTLVEVLIIVVILGILAAIAIPQFTGAARSEDALKMLTALHTLRQKIDNATKDHQGKYPDLLSRGWEPLIAATKPTPDYNLEDADVGAKKTATAGPYLWGPLLNPLQKSNLISQAPLPGAGWVYNSQTGRVKACINSEDKGLMAFDVEDVAVYDAYGSR